MFWAEDYVFSVPEVPQIVSWMFGTDASGDEVSQPADPLST